MAADHLNRVMLVALGIAVLALVGALVYFLLLKSQPAMDMRGGFTGHSSGR